MNEKPLSPGAERLRQFLIEIYSTPSPEIEYDEAGMPQVVSRPPPETPATFDKKFPVEL